MQHLPIFKDETLILVVVMTEHLCGGGVPLGDLGIPLSVMEKLLKADINTTKDVTGLSPSELSEVTELSVGESEEVLRLAANRQQPNPVDMLQMFQEGRELPQIITFCKALDTLLGGGIPLQAITEVSGSSGVGKTQMCLQACVSVQLPQSVGGAGGEAVYVDTEGSFSVQRLKDVASHAVRHIQAVGGEGDDVADFTVQSVLKGTHYYRCMNIIEVLAVLKSIPELVQAHPKIQLLVIDSLSFHFRYELPDGMNREEMLDIVAKELIKPARTYKMSVLVINHLTPRMDGGTARVLKPALGATWDPYPTIRLNLQWSGETRMATVTKAPHCQNSSAYFQVSVGGLRDVGVGQGTSGCLGDESGAKKRKFEDTDTS